MYLFPFWLKTERLAVFTSITFGNTTMPADSLNTFSSLKSHSMSPDEIVAGPKKKHATVVAQYGV